MSEAEIRETVERMRAEPKYKAALLDQAIRGDASALFVIRAMRIRFGLRAEGRP